MEYESIVGKTMRSTDTRVHTVNERFEEEEAAQTVEGRRNGKGGGGTAMMLQLVALVEWISARGSFAWSFRT